MATPKRPNPDHVVDAALRLAAERRWRDVSLRDIAGEAGVTLVQLRTMFPSKTAILAAFTDRIDATVIAGTDEEALGEPARDRVFDVIVRRFEALKPYRTALGSIVRDVGMSPAAGLAVGCRLLRSMAWSLEAAGISAAGPCGRLRTRGLAALYVAAFPVFLRDDTEDLSRTMASLDRSLGRVDGLLSRLRPRGRPRPEAGEAA